MNSTSSFNLKDNLICPACKTFMEEFAGYFLCNSCNSKYLVKNNIPIFVPVNGKYADISDDIMSDILLNMDIKPWQEVINNAFAEKNPWLYQIIIDHTRTDYLFLYDFKEGDLVLDVGSGWGQSAFALANRVKSVIALDPNFQRVKFIAKKAKCENINNIKPIQADVLNLPFKDDTFDFISMIGVLEWVANDTEVGDPREIQLNALKEVFRVLKKGKSICIGIENSDAWAYKFGKPDDHTGIKHISYLSRDEANILSKKNTGRDYRTYTYNRDGYIRLLKKSGFTEENISFNYPIPSYKEPTYIIPLESKKALEYYHSNLSGVEDPNTCEGKVKTAEMKSMANGDYLNKVSSYFIFAKK